MGVKKWTQEQELQIIQDWHAWGHAQGVTNFAAAKSCVHETMRNLLLKHKITWARKSRFSIARKEELVSLWEKHHKMGIQPFCRKFKTHSATLKAILEENGTPYASPKIKIDNTEIKKTKQSDFQAVKPMKGRSVYLGEMPNQGFCKFPNLISSEKGIDTHEWCGERSGESPWCPNHKMICFSSTYHPPKAVYFARKTC